MTLDESLQFAGANDHENQRIIDLPNCGDTLKNHLREQGVTRVLIVHGQTSYDKSGARLFFNSLEQHFSCVHFSDFTPDPTFEEGLVGARVFQEHKCDAIVAVGGGSAIDVAKLINVFQAHPGDELGLAKGTVKVSAYLAHLVAVPTTAGSGSEATHFAVVYIDGVKYSVASPTMRPNSVILNPDFMTALRGKQLWAPVFDAICQAIESFWSVSATEETQALSSQAIEHAWPILQRANVPSPLERTHLMAAANLAGQAINVTKTTAPHALAYVLSSKFGVPHGNAVALFLKPFFALNTKLAMSGKATNIAPEILEQRMKTVLSLLNFSTVEEAEIGWQDVLKRCGLVSSLREAGVASPTDIAQIVDGVNAERLGNHPAILGHDRLYELVRRLYDANVGGRT